MADRPLYQWEIIRAQERAEALARCQADLAKCIRSWKHLTPEQKTEAERLIALPYGVEGEALLNFVLDHHPICPRKRVAA